jgi:putative endonuclease
MYYVYILRCKDGSLYTGIAKDLEARLKVHRQGKGSKYVRSRLPFTLVYKEKLASKEAALKWEINIKSMSKERKGRLINSF